MAELYYPFATGPGANANEVAWGNIFIAMGRPGVLIGEGTEFNVTAPGGAAVQVGTGRAHCFGHYYELDATSGNLTVAANSGAVRYDRVVIRFDFVNDNAHALVLTGSTSAAATLQTDRSGLYDLPLAVLAVPTGAGVVTGSITMALDRWALPLHSLPAGVLLPCAFQSDVLPKTLILARGQTVKRFEYERLWAQLSYGPTADRVHGRVVSGSGATPGNDTLIIPDLRGRAFFGLDDMGGGNAARLAHVDVMGAGFGSHDITSADLPQHTHLLDNASAQAQFFIKKAGQSTAVQAVSGAAGVSGTWAHMSGISLNVAAAGETFATGFNPSANPDPDNNMPPAMLGYWLLTV